MERNTTTTAAEAEPETTREPIAQHGQYLITEIKKIDGITPHFDAYDLIIRGHTNLMVAEQQAADALEALELSFTRGPAAVKDLGTELLRASHIVIPLDAIQTLEDVTGQTYDDSRWIQNPLNYSPPFRSNPITYPSNPATPASTNSDSDSDTGITARI